MKESSSPAGPVGWLCLADVRYLLLRVKLFLHIRFIFGFDGGNSALFFFSSPITSACVFFRRQEPACRLFHSSFRLSSFSVFSLFRFFQLAVYTVQFGNPVCAVRFPIGLFWHSVPHWLSSFHSSKLSISCWYWRSNCSSSYSIWLIMAFCSFICGWYLRFNCSCTLLPFSLLALHGSSDFFRRFSPFSFSTI